MLTSQSKLVLLFATVCCLTVGAFSSNLSAAILTGSGPNLPFPVPNPAWPPGVSPVRVQTGPAFTGTWSSPAQPNWVGTYNANGLIPGSSATGITRYDFTSLPLGYLPAGTFFIFGDVDGGSGNPERFDLTAFDNSNSIITNEWLGATIGPNSVHAVRNSGGSGPFGTVELINMPGWSWQGTNPNGYHITGSTASGNGTFPVNPAIALALVSNQPVYRMELNKPTTSYGFSLQAPVVPEPSTTMLAVLALLGTMSSTAVRRRRTAQVQ